MSNDEGRPVKPHRSGGGQFVEPFPMALPNGEMPHHEPSDKNDAALTYLTDVANAFDPVEGPVEFEPNTWMRIRNAIFDLSAPALMATSHKREISPGAIPAEGATPRMDASLGKGIDRILATGYLLEKDLANATWRGDQFQTRNGELNQLLDEAKAHFEAERLAKLVILKRAEKVERELASKTRDADHFFQLSGKYLNELAAHEAVRDACFDALGPECHVWGDVPGCIEELKRELAEMTITATRQYQEGYGKGAENQAARSSTQSPIDCHDEPLREMCIDYRTAHPYHAEAAFQKIVAFCKAYPSATNDTDRKLGGILLRYIDRLTDPVPDDPIENIVAEMDAEVDAVITAARATATETQDITCPDCKGAGTVVATTTHLGPDDHTYDAECPRCGGQGAISGKRT